MLVQLLRLVVEHGASLRLQLVDYSIARVSYRGGGGGGGGREDIPPKMAHL